jgi:hypothetical protein
LLPIEKVVAMEGKGAESDMVSNISCRVFSQKKINCGVCNLYEHKGCAAAAWILPIKEEGGDESGAQLDKTGVCGLEVWPPLIV